MFDRNRDLLPLVSRYAVGKDSQQVIDEKLTQLGTKVSAKRRQHFLMQEYDFYQFEAELRDRLLRGTAPVAIALRHFQYSGELRATGQLRLFAQRIPQLPLPPSTLEAIVSEIDTRQRLTGKPGIKFSLPPTTRLTNLLPLRTL